MGSYIWPCPSYSYISSKYGPRNCPFHGWELHTGVDLACAAGRNILATRAGTVKTVGNHKSLGLYLDIDHGGGITSRYQHCSKIYMRKGDKVGAGAVIALVGSTGNSTGAHLHFEIRINGGTRNPLNYVSPKDTIANFTGPKGTTKTASPSSGSNTAASSGGGAQSKPAEEKTVDITKVVVKSINGNSGIYKYNSLLSMDAVSNYGCEILIENDKIYLPCLEGDVTLDYERKGSPGTLKLNVIQDSILNIQEGNPIRFRYRGNNAFYGYIFTKKRKDNGIIELTCYDQLRYLKNKDTLIYSKKKYSDLLKMIADDYGLKCGTIEDTGYVIESRVEEGTLLDILANASDLTVINKGKLYVLYDDFGKLCLKDIQSMLLPILVDEDTAESYDYSSTIDDNVYNRIKLAVDNDKTGERELYITNDAVNQSVWGVLQYYEKLSDVTSTTVKEKGSTLLKYYNKKQRTLKIKNCMGDIRVRGGSSLVVKLDLPDMKVQNYMVVEKVKHTFNDDGHRMDLDVSGIKGEFNV